MNDSDEFRARYRETMGLFATGVAVVLAEHDGEVHGMTANSITSLSLDPTLLLFCPSKKSNMAAHVEPGAQFTVNILGDDQEALSNYFATGGDAPEFELVPWPAAGAVPRLGGCIGALACRVRERLEGGDHWIVVGEVLDLHKSDRRRGPLLFYGGRYHDPVEGPEDHLRPSGDPYE